MKIMVKICKHLVIILIFVLCINMGEGGRQSLSIDEPKFIPLEEGQGSFKATIFDDQAEIKIQDISFFGNTSLDGIMNEKDDSVNKIDIADISEINVINEHYKSSKYPRKDLCKVSIKSKKGAGLNNLLAPKKIVICGIREATGIQVSWFLSQIKKIQIGERTTSKKFIKYKKEKLQQKTILNELTTKETKTSKASKEIRLQKHVITEPAKEKRSLWDSFITIVDSIIDFAKLLLNKIFKFIKL
jgi:hypothetical protein